MGKDKYRRFQENLTFANMVQPDFEEVFGKEYRLKGHWHDEFFRNPNPIILELGCGRGEYTVALAERNPDRNYIGIDIKGAACGAVPKPLPSGGWQTPLSCARVSSSSTLSSRRERWMRYG